LNFGEQIALNKYSQFSILHSQLGAATGGCPVYPPCVASIAKIRSPFFKMHCSHFDFGITLSFTAKAMPRMLAISLLNSAEAHSPRLAKFALHIFPLIDSSNSQNPCVCYKIVQGPFFNIKRGEQTACAK
jgi:hypothetical protein